MWQQEKKDTSIVKLVLWVALATTPMAAMVVSAPTLAESAPETPSFPLPQTVENGTTIRIDGSSSLTAINQSLKDSFEKQFSGTKVEFTANGTEQALRDLLDGKIDIVAIGRGLTPAEKALGLEQVRLRREKIAIVVGADNPFKGSLTSRQFARIFRGQIKNWSQLGGPDAKIRVIDRPETSDTRDTFRDYPAFKTAKFATGSTATPVSEDNTAEIVKQLGKDGISYVLANQISKLENVRVLQLHQTLPDDPKYPFSQPLVYVYKKNPSLGAASFLGFTLAPAGQQAIEQARVAEAEAIAARVSQPTAVSPTTETTPGATTSPSAETTPAATASPNASTSVFGDQPFVAPNAEKTPIVNKETPFWLLLPLLLVTLGGGVLWWFFRTQRSLPEKTEDLPPANPNPTSTDDVEPAINPSPSTSVELPQQETPERTPFQIYNQTSSDVPQNGTPQYAANGSSSGVADGSENNNYGAAALMDGAALSTGIGAATWSNFADKQTDLENEALEISNHAGVSPPESSEAAWDIEAPAAVVNTSYPQLGNLPEETSEETTPQPQFADVPKATSDFEYWDTEVTDELVQQELKAELEWLESITAIEDPPLSEFDEVVANEQPAAETSPLVGLPEVPEDDAFNVVADAAEPLVEPSQSPDFASAAALAAGAGVAAWASTPDNAATPAATAHGFLDAQEHGSIVLIPRTPTSAHISWEISETLKSILRQHGVSHLLVRLYDVTGIDLSYQTPQLVREYESEELLSNDVEIPASDRDYIAEIGYLAEGDGWFAIARSAIVRVFSPVEPDPIVEELPASTETANGFIDEPKSSIVLTPQTHALADISWEIPESLKSALRQKGISQLVVRLYDVTGIDLSYQIPQLIGEYESEELLSSSVQIPATDRDYIAEIGYFDEGDRWFPITHSAIVHVFNPVEPDPIVEELPVATETANGLVDAEPESSIVLTSRTPKWAYVSWYISPAQKQALRQQGGSQLAVRLYDVTGIDLSYQTPQLVQQYECEEVANDRFVAIPASDRDYMAEIGYIADGDAYGGKQRWLHIARSPNIRVFNRPQKDFWFIADAELIIHGATEPNTSVAIGGHPIKVKPDGTFHLRLPFSDGLMDYLITVAAAGESPKTIHKKFSQETYES
ncbi:MAG: DUF4912 domain-containing protein [Nostoc sp. ChiSLP02]|nr:DUF4912 domain-containing protein [Nostoc sp. DedSLP05]MDZ8101965.1 DUF4912 domain-containing protein [Nostoc sp. DedSLP01]MDZ8185064.1 DUF4912 domain-containing protein [Nostoc sp. ChiSLP02]